MMMLRWCVLCCVGVFTSARPHMDAAITGTHSVPALSGSRPSEISTTNQKTLLQDIRHALHTRSGVLVVRGRRSVRGGCSLGTCTVHDLAHRLSQLNNRLRITQAPLDKISPQGYGR